MTRLLVFLLVFWWLALPMLTGVKRMPKGSPPPTKKDKPFGSQGRINTEFWGSKDRELMIEGPAGTGKSRAILEYLYAIANNNPGVRILIVRKTRKSLTESALVTFEDHVVCDRPKWVRNQKRWVRQTYELPNGSVFVIGSLENTDAFMSTEFDIIYVQEAREIEEGDWENLSSRLRNGRLSFHMMVGDTNPDGPTHWIKARERSGKLRCIVTRHEDNPRFFNAKLGKFTPEGEEYIGGTLDRLTGIRHKRLRLGLWVGAEGIIYDLFDPAVHVVAPFRIPAGWPRDITVDFGTTHAFVAQWWAEDPQGRLYLYRELYGTHRLVKDWAHKIFHYSRGEKIREHITDHDLTARADLENHMGHSEEECPDQAESKKGKGWVSPIVGTIPAIKDVERGLAATADRMKRAADGYPRIFFVKDCRVEIDQRLVEEKRPTCTVDEFPRYVWAVKRSLTAGNVTLAEPVKKDDDGMDAMRYRVMYSDAHLAPVSKLYGRSFSERVG